jgi:hypothetical protein
LNHIDRFVAYCLRLRDEKDEARQQIDGKARHRPRNEALGRPQRHALHETQEAEIEEAGGANQQAQANEVEALAERPEPCTWFRKISDSCVLRMKSMNGPWIVGSAVGSGSAGPQRRYAIKRPAMVAPVQRIRESSASAFTSEEIGAASASELRKTRRRMRRRQAALEKDERKLDEEDGLNRLMFRVGRKQGEAGRRR